MLLLLKISDNNSKRYGTSVYGIHVHIIQIA